MTGELRCRALSETLELALRAAAGAGVTRVSDITAFGAPGIPVFQATRPAARSLSVAQGKGLTPTAAIVSALLEAVEAWTAESLAQPATGRPLAELAADDIAAWSGQRDALAIDLDRTTTRAWLQGTDLITGRARAVPWDLLSLDFTGKPRDCLATSCGLACGNTRTEALVSGVGELLEHHAIAGFDRLTPTDKLARQIALASIGDPAIRRLLRLVAAAGFEVRAWSMAQDAGFPAILCSLFPGELCLDGMSPVAGSGCHPSSRVAFLRALLEAVQTRAGLVAGARDDLRSEDYGVGGERALALLFASFAFGDGALDWASVPTADCPSSEHCLASLLAAAERLTSLPLIAFDHAPPAPGLHLAHVLAPGLMDQDRRSERTLPAGSGEAPRRAPQRCRARAARKVLFAGPSVAGLPIPDGIELRPPARCGDIAALLDDPPDAIGLVDGYFKIARTVWHKEIMGLLARGTRVIGGASLGALRATELERFGMEGVGAIFAAYRSGTVVRDDAVMLVHAPAELGCAPLSLPQVDAEHVLLLADLPASARRAMQRIVRRAPFETRTWPACLAEYRSRTGEDFPIAADVLAAAPSLKRIDAKLVIEALAEERPAKPTGERCAPPLTSHYRALLATTARAFAAGPA